MDQMVGALGGPPASTLALPTSVAPQHPLRSFARAVFSLQLHHDGQHPRSGSYTVIPTLPTSTLKPHKPRPVQGEMPIDFRL